MFDNFKNMAGLMGQAKQLRERYEQVQAELANKSVEGDAGAGAVRVTINGRLEVVGVSLDRPLIQTLAGQGDQADQTVIEDLLAAAFNDAVARAQELIREEMARASEGLDLPGMDQMLKNLGN